MKEFVIIWRCIGQYLSKTIVALYHEGMKTEWDTKKEIRRGTHEGKYNERQVNYILKMK